VQLVSGTIYANLHPKKSGNKTGDHFQLNFAHESVTVAESVHFRVELDGDSKATVAVFKGKLSATSPSGQFDVAEKHSATIDLTKDDLAKNDPARKDAFVIAKNFEAEPSDAWDRQQTDYHDRYASAGGSGISSPYGYGMSDLNYYGSFMNVAGYGNVWQPYFIGADWSPFQDGGWAFYPGSGYMWVSGYPWGWMPYHQSGLRWLRSAARIGAPPRPRRENNGANFASRHSRDPSSSFDRHNANRLRHESKFTFNKRRDFYWDGSDGGAAPVVRAVVASALKLAVSI
jgi:hypothetical protein